MTRFMTMVEAAHARAEPAMNVLPIHRSMVVHFDAGRCEEQNGHAGQRQHQASQKTPGHPFFQEQDGKERGEQRVEGDHQ